MPTKRSRLTKELIETIAERIEMGLPLHAAAQSCGVPPDTAKDWLKRGRGTHGTREPTAQTRAFAERVETAYANQQYYAIQKINAAADDDWKAAAWVLTHGPAKREWGEHTEHHITEKTTERVAVIERIIEHPALAAAAEELLIGALEGEPGGDGRDAIEARAT